MPIETITLIPNKLFHHKVTGYLILADFITYLKAFWTNNKILEDKVNAIWDLTDADLSKLSFESIDNLAENIIENKFVPYKPGLSAVLIDDIPEKHLIVYLSSIMSKVHAREIRLFIDYDEAFEHVNSNL